jgi:DNA polymerase-3 subunit epsilon
MLNNLLQIDRPLFVVDVEATSLDTQTARIVEIAFQRWEASGMTREWSSRINPGIPIPAESTAVHHITDVDVAGKPMFKQLAANLAKGFSNCSFSGQNCRYDLQVIQSEMTRAGQPWSYAGAVIIDSSQLERLAVPRNLSALHEKYTGKPHDGAHGALSDVRAAATVIAAQLETHPNLPRDLDLLHKAQWPEEWLDGKGQFKTVNGVPTCTFGKHKGKAMRDVPIDYYDWILRSDVNMPADVKALAQAAKLGNYPGDK